MKALLKRVPLWVYAIVGGLEVVAVACASVGYRDWPVLAIGAAVFGVVLAITAAGPAATEPTE